MNIDDGTYPTVDETIPSIDRLREIEALMARRLDALERENHRLKRRERMHWIATAAVVGVALIPMIAVARQSGAAHVSERVQAREFVLRSGSGVERGRWEVMEDGQVGISLRDGAGRERLRMALLPDGSPGVTLADERGRPRVVVGALADGTTNFVIADRQGRTRIVLGQSAHDDLSLLMADGEGVTRAVLALDGNGEADFSLYPRTSRQDPPVVEPSDSAAASESTGGSERGASDE